MAEPRVTCEGLGKRYGELWALRGADLTFHKREVVMLIGPNASGKTTLIKCLLGLVHPTEGRIIVEDTVIDARAPQPDYRNSIGYMPQISQFPPSLTIAQLFAMMADVRGLAPDQLDDRLIAELGLDRQLDKRLSTLSGGTRQKVSAVLAFRTHPTILVMDEPTAGLDPVSAARVLKEAGALRDGGGTVLITSHLMEEVEALADRVAYLEDGALRFLLPMNDILERTGATRLAQGLPRLLEQMNEPRPTH
ncbi:MAG: ABC transporter ATP-binding protein [Flavobacteriales bacterium]|jgi:Cu-processing system ATP-binding protein|nr:ABC transporter ATP-binding protein [Flavobacteriales bacterium]